MMHCMKLAQCLLCECAALQLKNWAWGNNENPIFYTRLNSFYFFSYENHLVRCQISAACNYANKYCSFFPLLTKENKNNLHVINGCIRWPELTLTNLMAGEVPYATAGTVLPRGWLHIIVAKDDSYSSCSNASNRLTEACY